MLIDGVNAKTYGFVLSEAPGWLDAPPLQVPTAQIPNRGQIVIGDPVVQSKRITLRGYVRGSSVADSRTRLDALKKALSFAPVKVIFDDITTRYHSLYLQSFSASSLPQGSFVVKDVRVEATFLASSSYALDNDETTVITYDPLIMGTGPIRPFVSLLGIAFTAGWSIRLKDYLGNVVQEMVFNTNLNSVPPLYIDCEARTITRGGYDWLPYLSSGDFFEIEPALHADYANSLWPTMDVIGLDGGGPPVATYRKTWR